MASPLMSSFQKYFTKTPSNLLRSVNFGKSIFKFLNRNSSQPVAVPEDPAVLLRQVNKMMQTGKFNGVTFTDEMFVRFFIEKVMDDSGLITYDMIADMMESDAYKSFGAKNGTEDYLVKRKFERWIYHKSILAKINQIPFIDVALHEDGMRRTIAAVNPKNKKVNNDKIYTAQIDAKVKEFDEAFNQNPDALSKLKDLAKANKSKKSNHTNWAKGVYGVLCQPDEANCFSETFDFVNTASGVKNRELNMFGLVTATNKAIVALGKRNNWSEADIDTILVKTGPELSAERFKQKQASFNRPTEIKNYEQKTAWYQKHWAVDVGTTFLSTAGYSAAITALSTINPIVGTLTAVGGVAAAGLCSLVSSYKAAKKQGEITKKQAWSMAGKAGLAMVKKMAPYAISLSLGKYGRMAGAAVVFGKTFLNDIERRAAFNEQELVEESTGVKVKQSKLRHFAKVCKKVSLLDGLKSLGYAAAKGVAVYAGGVGGEHLGSRLGNLAFGTGTFERPLKLQKEQVQEKVNQNELHAENTLTEENLQSLDEMDSIELTENARKTAYEANDRQYINGVQQDWYTAEGQANAKAILEKYGVDDAMGVLRKVGSAARFFGGEYQATLDHLCAGEIDNQDVECIIKSLELINKEGGLASVAMPENISEAVHQTQAPVHVEMPSSVSQSMYDLDTTTTSIQMPENIVEAVHTNEVPTRVEMPSSVNQSLYKVDAVTENISMPETITESVHEDETPLDYRTDMPSSIEQSVYQKLMTEDVQMPENVEAAQFGINPAENKEISDIDNEPEQIPLPENIIESQFNEDVTSQPIYESTDVQTVANEEMTLNQNKDALKRFRSPIPTPAELAKMIFNNDSNVVLDKNDGNNYDSENQTTIKMPESINDYVAE